MKKKVNAFEPKAAKNKNLGDKPKVNNYLNNLQDGYFEYIDEMELAMDIQKDDEEEYKNKLKAKNKAKQVSEFEKKTYQAQLEKIQFLQDYYHKPGDLMPFVFFYKFLAKRPEFGNKEAKMNKLQLWVPDTVVYNDNCPPFWIYTAQDGFVYRTETFMDKHIVSQFNSGIAGDELVAVAKSPEMGGSGFTGNSVNLLSASDLESQLSSYISAANGVCAIQRFVRCKGPNAFVCRAVWKKDQPSYAFVMTNKTSLHEPVEESEKEKYVVNPAKMYTCSIMTSKGGKHCEDTCFYINNIVRYISRNTGVQFSEFVADFIKDQNQIWWLTGVKGFIISNPLSKFKFTHFTYAIEDYEEADEEGLNNRKRQSMEKSEGRVRQCKLCQLNYPVAQMQNQLTLKMIQDCEQQVRLIGSQLSWIDYADSKFYDKNQLYHSYRVCHSCFTLYKQLEELRSLQLKLAKAVGVSVKLDEARVVMQSEIRGMKPDGENRMNANKVNQFDQSTKDRVKGIQGQGLWDVPVQKQEEFNIIDDLPRSKVDGKVLKKLNLYKLIVIFHEMDEIETQYRHKNSFLEYSILDETVKYKLKGFEHYQDQGNWYPINKMRMFYFFSEKRVINSGSKGQQTQEILEEGLDDFLSENQVFNIIFGDGMFEIANLNFTMKEFSSPVVNRKGFNTFIQGKDFQAYFKGMVGVDSTPIEYDIQAIDLTFYQGIYLPPKGFCSPEALPDEWIECLPNITEANNRLFSYQMQNLGISLAEHESDFKIRPMHEKLAKLDSQPLLVGSSKYDGNNDLNSSGYGPRIKDRDSSQGKQRRQRVQSAVIRRKQRPLSSGIYTVRKNDNMASLTTNQGSQQLYPSMGGSTLALPNEENHSLYYAHNSKPVTSHQRKIKSSRNQSSTLRNSMKYGQSYDADAIIAGQGNQTDSLNPFNKYMTLQKFQHRVPEQQTIQGENYYDARKKERLITGVSQHNRIRSKSRSKGLRKSQKAHNQDPLESLLNHKLREAFSQRQSTLQ